MKALQLVEWKKPPEVREVPQPEPGPGEVVIKVAGAGACHSDLHVMEFEPGMLPCDVPFTLGHENAGWVEAVGEGVRMEIGQPVAVYGPWGCGLCRRCAGGSENYCERQQKLGSLAGGVGRDGGMATHLLVPSARLLVPLGDMDPVEAAPLTDAGLTPYHAIKRSLSVLVPGSTAVVIGVGGLGHMGVQILKAISPATVVAVDRREPALKLADDGGADHSIVMGPDTASAISSLTKGKGAELVLDFVGVDETMALGVAVSRQLGHLTVVGVAGGTFPYSFFSVPYELSMSTSYWGSLPELTEVLALAETGKIKPHIQRYSLAEAMQAYRDMHDGAVEGRAVIVPSL